MSQESDVLQDASLPWMTKLKNRMLYKMDQWVNDPIANRFAAHLKPEPPTASTPATEKKPVETYEEKEEPDDDPNEEASVGRILKKTWKYLKLIAEHAFYPVLALIVASYIANEMIVFPPPMRFAMFVFVFILSLVFHPAALALLFYYACKRGYSYYVNDMENGPKRRIMPHIFAMLPLSTYQYEAGFTSLFMYPFTYPKTEEDASELPLIMADYYKTLESSFGYLKKMANLPFFAEGISKIKTQMEHMHDMKYPVEEETEETEVTPSAPPLPPTIEQTTGNQTPPTNTGQQVETAPPTIIPSQQAETATVTEEPSEEQKEQI
jgi:hypothetical protein